MLVDAALALHDNRLEVAEPLLRQYLKRDPFDARAIRMLAELAGRIGRNRDAENVAPRPRAGTGARLHRGARQPRHRPVPPEPSDRGAGRARHVAGGGAGASRLCQPQGGGARAARQFRGGDRALTNASSPSRPTSPRCG
ncbi:hypothetical protein AB5I41_13000 [Sphingomonas sp. MMS24-JH45]